MSLRPKAGGSGARKSGKRGKLTITKAKKEAWIWFSRYIRLRDSANGFAACCTCGRTLPISGVGCIHAGHFVAGRTNAVLFKEENCHPQCYVCNMYDSGAWVEYEAFIIRKYGQETCDNLKRLRHTILQYTIQDFQTLAVLYKGRVEELGGWPT